MRPAELTNLIQHKEAEGVRAVTLHSESPQDYPIVDDKAYLLECEKQSALVTAQVEVLQTLDSCDTRFPDLLKSVCEHYYARGILRTLRELGGVREINAPYFVNLATYNGASDLEKNGHPAESRPLFESIVRDGEKEFLAGAAYHLACIEEVLGDTGKSRYWYERCVRANPGHKKAREALKLPHVFHEVRPNIFKRTGWSGTPQILLVVFGALGDVINAFPVVAGLRRKYPLSKITWLTLPVFGDLVRRSAAHHVEVYETRGVIPWDWADAEGFTHIYYPEGNANHEESRQSGLHMIDFMAAKCKVELSSHRTIIRPATAAVVQAAEFLKQQKLTPNSYVAASHMGISSRYWPHWKLEWIVRRLNVPILLLGGPTDPEIAGTIPCFGRSFGMAIELIRGSTFFIGPDSGVSWLATTTEAPMGVFLDPLRKRTFNVGFKDVLGEEKTNIEEWTIYEDPEVVLDRIHAQDHRGTFKKRQYCPERFSVFPMKASNGPA